MAHLEWLCDLDSEFVAPAELLRETFPARVGDYEVTVHLPSLPAAADAWYLTQPAIWGVAEPSDEWGMIHQRGAEGPKGVMVKRLLLTAKVAGSEAEIHGIAYASNNERAAWVSNLQAWLEVVTGQHLTPIGHRKPKMIGSLPIWSVSTVESDRQPITFPGTTRITFPRPLIPAVTAELIAGCLSLAPEGPPHLAWLLLRDARSLSAAGQHRRAVIDAATAAELAITLMMDILLEKIGAAERDSLRKKPKTLGSKVDLLADLGRPLADDLYEKLVDKRNDAVHEGSAIGVGHCDIAIEAAAAVVELAYPLPAVLGGRRWPVRNAPGHDERGATGEVRTR